MASVRTRFVSLVVSLAAVSACARPESSRVALLHPGLAPQPSSSRYANVHDIARRLQTDVVIDETTGVHHVRRGSRHVAVAPGVAAVLLGDRVRSLDEDVIVRYGRPYVPASVAAEIESYLRRGKPSTRVKPANGSKVTPPVQVKGPLGHICIDAGHGGKDPGAVSRWGLREKDVVLPTTKYLAAELRGLGYTVTMTRDRDVFLELDDRPAVARREGAGVFVSVHANATSKSSVRGMEVFYWDGRLSGIGSSKTRRESQKLAGQITTACQRQGLTVYSTRGASFRVIRMAGMPAVLVETGFLTNRADERLLRTDAHRRHLARAIASGIHAYCKSQ
ncbi:MAG: N-acetylmuramoyl-L-alanine amidase [Candidatus Brocadiae bacterium]|nr:N-acetylmuramoyl-L-alanine amidase [Candidatus Brocadiia bacterium]